MTTTAEQWFDDALAHLVSAGGRIVARISQFPVAVVDAPPGWRHSAVRITEVESWLDVERNTAPGQHDVADGDGGAGRDVPRGGVEPVE